MLCLLIFCCGHYTLNIFGIKKSFNANIRVRDFIIIIIIKMLCIILLYEALYVSNKQVIIVWVTFFKLMF